MILKDIVIEHVQRKAKKDGVKPTTVVRRCLSDARYLDRLMDGKITVKNAQRLIEYCTDQ